MCSAALGFVFAGEHLTQFFLGENNQSTGVVAAELLKIVAVSMPALAICMIGAGTLRGSGDTRWPLVITLSGFCLIRIPLAAMLGWSPTTVEGWWLADYCWGLGVQGAWYSMVVDLYLRAVLILARLWHGGWQDVKLPH